MGSITILESINRALVDAMEADEAVLILGEDVADPEDGGVLGVTKGLSTRFGDHRVRSTPIAEQAIVGAAIGVSLGGFKPVAEIMLMNFTTVAMDMIVNHAAKLRFMSGGQTNVPIVIRTMTGSGFANGGQHSDYLEAWFAHTAGIKVVAPSNPSDAYGLLRSAIDDPDPVIFIENLPTYFTKGEAPESGHRVPIGKASVVREGSDVTVIAYAKMVQEAAAAVEALASRGISAELIDLRSIAPWDRETVLASVKKTGRAIVVHEAVTPFGAGAEISSVIHENLFHALKAPVQRLGAAFCPVPFSRPLESAFAPDAAAIEAAVGRLLT
ncbi:MULTISPECIES: alpha-ketoacid dehydrogenase subunit beta [unclassified Sphingopyxis]|uniref:alpha-ketoacid dehydrogenase subunit beta n=1 Tax=unclassified Sphingopyxis TaxID=2614943 RepID=UPI00073139BD|nr:MULTISPECIES: alpha-ketoacid dehydrogenase subunit beta [unclassified Sphingopyxis]KTE26387.1 pyruvate dehydrogenase [Sphingopyxis sp. H057]KTE52791.1 pyruvate dehydrogenase [Sphingopyxis sp. H073]KTE54981.1 pyruvate dehydrogenase [Sphingopyxis sp. H071]KTE62442.1 pyruvate dehydrogenase [Sphingopyxis sp. H107]KTE65987.1 pyruvate dehydrogenase [Sphingopyxis sp. H100]